ncbi:hypothetical protein [Chitinophaga sp. HK235]|uniref:hypothetical protein n=1 Tax=Chitinophaga sp. HK235 TaxID=2952571 RepID=UPI001BA4BCEF|nr:hypothetical protein [Chitinophaga sp. HK235]
MKKLFLLAAACIAGFSSYSQSFVHGAGVVAFIQTAANSDAFAVGGLTYSPRFNFMEQDNMSLSLGVPLSIGLGGSYNSSYGSYSGESNNLSFIFNAPLVFNANFGRGSSRDADGRFGFFVGAGYGFHYSSRNQNYYNNVSGDYSASAKSSTNGPMGNAGFRIGVGRVHNIEVKLSYMKGLSDDKPNVFSIGTLFNF